MDTQFGSSVAAQSPSSSASDQDELLVRVGQITRTLHDSLRELGFDKVLEKVSMDIPDVKDRLNYVAKMTEQAAQRVLDATDTAIPIQERIDAGASEILSGWQATLNAPFSEASYRDMATLTMQCLTEMRNDSAATKQQLLDIMMAQDFQDLTGQVVRKVTDLAHVLEKQLVHLLVDFSYADGRKEPNKCLLNGPVVNTNNATDVVVDQEQVDDLLGSLGF